MTERRRVVFAKKGWVSLSVNRDLQIGSMMMRGIFTSQGHLRTAWNRPRNGGWELKDNSDCGLSGRQKVKNKIKIELVRRIVAQTLQLHVVYFF